MKKTLFYSTLKSWKGWLERSMVRSCSNRSIPLFHFFTMPFGKYFNTSIVVIVVRFLLVANTRKLVWSWNAVTAFERRDDGRSRVARFVIPTWLSFCPHHSHKSNKRLRKHTNLKTGLLLEERVGFRLTYTTHQPDDRN